MNVRNIIIKSVQISIIFSFGTLMGMTMVTNALYGKKTVLDNIEIANINIHNKTKNIKHKICKITTPYFHIHSKK